MATANTFPLTPRGSDIEQLKSFCRGELAAVDTYKQALASGPFPSLADVLSRCLASHERRVVMLEDKIVELGGQIPQSSGPWGAFAMAVSRAANAISEKAMVTVLEEGEDLGMRDYRTDVNKLEAPTREFVEDRVVPEQIDSHQMMSTLKHTLS